MKARFYLSLTLSLIASLLAACRPTPVPPTPALTVIIEEKRATPLPPTGAVFEQEIDYSLYPPGTVFFIDEEGNLTSTRTLPGLSYPEWDAQDFPKGFNAVLNPGNWKKFLLGPASEQRGFLVDVTPASDSTEGAEIVWQVMPEYDGESWQDVLWLLQPRDALPLAVYVKVYTTQGWRIALQGNLVLSPGGWQDFNLGQASAQRGLIVDASPTGAGELGDSLHRLMIYPAFRGGWQDALRIQTPAHQAEMHTDVTIFETPTTLFKSGFTQQLQPGEWYMSVLGPSSEQAAYLVEATPLSDYESQVESYGVQTKFIDGAWFDIVRIKIGVDQRAMDVNLRVYAIGPDSLAGEIKQGPTLTPPPSPTITPTPSVVLQASCPGALVSRLQVGELGMVSFDPPLANRVRIEPDQEAEVLGQIMPGEEFIILEGPYCADGWAWWRVRSRTQELEGWTAEGDAENYWLAPLEPEIAQGGAEQNPITLTAGQVIGANDIEAAINRSTANGTRPGTVILDGRDGAFVYTVDDRSLNIFVSNLTLRGVNQVVIKNCGDGLYFDYLPDSPPENILVEGIEFNCEGDGLAASGSFEKVTLRKNSFYGGRNGISMAGASSNWLITDNTIIAEGGGIEITGAKNIVISKNHISGYIGILLRQCSQFQVQENAIQAIYQGMLLARQARDNTLQENTIKGVSRSGVALESGVTGNRILDNEVSCASGINCLNIDALPEVAEKNTIYPIEAKITYSNDFENSAGEQWSDHQIETSPTGKKFLGQFGNDQVSLNLTNLEAHTEIRVVFDLYIIRSWDGNVDPDLWEFKVDGRSLLSTTFDNQDYYSDHSQAYPDNFRKGSHPPRTGVKEINILGYRFDNRKLDSVYTLSFTVPHTLSTLELIFVAKGLTPDLFDEGWGIDNVTVYTIK